MDTEFSVPALISQWFDIICLTETVKLMGLYVSACKTPATVIIPQKPAGRFREMLSGS